MTTNNSINTPFPIPGSDITGSALTSVNDTNVTLTLGGTPSTSLLRSSSITAGWTGTLGVTRGGTGTGTQFTTGSIVFAGASGVYSQNNSQFFWDNTNSRIGIGTASPTYTIDIQESSLVNLIGLNVNNTTSGGISTVSLRRIDSSSFCYVGFYTAGGIQFLFGQNALGGSNLVWSNGTSNLLTLDNSGNFVVTAKMSSASANISGLTASSTVFTDGSKNLTSSGTVAQSNGGTSSTSYNTNSVIFQNSGNTAFTSTSDFTYNSSNANLAITTSLSSPFFLLNSTLTGSVSNSTIGIGRSDTVNGSAMFGWYDSSTLRWASSIYGSATGLGTGNVDDLIFRAAAGGGGVGNVLYLGFSTADITAVQGNLIVNTAGKTIKIKQGSNSCSGTGATMTAGSVTVSTTAVSTGDIVLLTRTTAAGTLGTGMPTVTISNGVSFTLTSSSALETSTYSWVIVKAA